MSLQRRRTRSIYRSDITIVLVLVVILVLWKGRDLKDINDEKQFLSTPSYDEKEKLALASKTGSSLRIRNPLAEVNDVIYELPTRFPDVPVALLFLGHGCNHSHKDFFPKDVDFCHDCIGLPEELAIVKLALENNVAVVALSSLNRSTKCWSVYDGELVAGVLEELQTKLQKQVSHIPIFAFGASSGGKFVSQILPDAMKRKGLLLDGFIAQIGSARSQYRIDIPAVYITMIRDARDTGKAKSFVYDLQKRNVPSLQIGLPPLSLNFSFFSDRISEYSEIESEKMVKALQKAEMIDENKMLIEDPRDSKWRDIIRPFVKESPSMTADASPLSEVMNAAYARHEMSRDGVLRGLKFLLQSLDN